MLTNSFLHIPSIGAKTEIRIWDSGITTIDDFLHSPPGFIAAGKRKIMTDCLLVSKEKLQCRDPGYFYDNLPAGEHWRLFREYQDTAAYLDIETTGLGPEADITTIALYDGNKIKHYINGQNLEDFPEDILRYKVIITYNGKTFDVPVIERFFGIRIVQAHIDLRYILRNLGYSGGLKSCERQLGIGRMDTLADIDGVFAVFLWQEYQRNKNEKALETLLSYNIEDVLNLEYLMIEAYNQKLRSIPFIVDEIGFPKTPANPFQVDAETVDRIKERCFTGYY